jgi:DNA-binding response OmpR family regulator
MSDADDRDARRPCRAAIIGLCQLEAKIDHYLASKTEDAIDVLLVEEDPNLAEKYRLRLQLDGYRVRVARDTKSALETVTAGRPELVFLDIRLTGVKGLKVLKRLRSTAAGAGLPVVVLLSEHDRELGERARELGALEWRVKNIIWP